MGKGNKPVFRLKGNEFFGKCFLENAGDFFGSGGNFFKKQTHSSYHISEKRMNIVVFGTPQLSADMFEALFHEEDIHILAAVTAPDMPAGRGKKRRPPPVKVWAEERGIPVFQPNRPCELLHHPLWKRVEKGIVIAYGKLFSEEFLAHMPELWNVHFSLLPEFRGASPVPAAILAGKKESGVTVFHIAKGMDDGDIVGQKRIRIENMRADAVFEAMKVKGVELLIHLLHSPPEKKRPQEHARATWCGKIEKRDGFLHPQEISAEMALRKVNAYFPWPGTSVEFEGKRLKILRAKKNEKKISAGHFVFEEKKLFLGFQEKSLELVEVQPEGKRAMSGSDFARGRGISASLSS